MKKVILFVTYTMATPIVGGAFIRALRLAMEMERRGWQPIIANWGPLLDDPKVAEAQGLIRFILLDRAEPGLSVQSLARKFGQLDPQVVVMGEGPFPAMEIFYYGAQRLNCPFVVLDQFYNHELMPHKKDVDAVLLYGLASFWEADLPLPPPYEMVAPFIEKVTPKLQLPIPEHLHSQPWITLIAYDDHVCDKGFELLARLKDSCPPVVAISRKPEQCRHIARFHNIDLKRLVTLPLQSDANVFGFFAGSAAALVSNGFLQIMEALAMAAPVIALERGHGVGMNAFNIDERFFPYVSFEDSLDQQAAYLREWLEASPFTPQLRSRLARERNGIAYCADRIEALHHRWLDRPRWIRAAQGWVRREFDGLSQRLQANRKSA